ncbi:MAG: cell wall hydrolase [Rhodovibrionaceae bacterium]
MSRLSLIAFAAALFFGTALHAQAEETGIDAADLECLALNVYWEARGEDRLGQEAVAHVTLNRVSAAGFPDSVCDVVKQEVVSSDDEIVSCQFSWWCDGRPDTPADNAVWEKARYIAWAAMTGRIGDPTDGALYFHHSQVAPTWIAQLHHTATIGVHLFYR